MVHSIELVFDSDTEAAIRRIWADLAAVGIPSQAPASRPHASMVVAEHIAADVDALLESLAQRLPLGCVVGAPVLFGRAKVVLARLRGADERSARACTRRPTGCAVRT